MKHESRGGETDCQTDKSASDCTLGTGQHGPENRASNRKEQRQQASNCSHGPSLNRARAPREFERRAHSIYRTAAEVPNDRGLLMRIRSLSGPRLAQAAISSSAGPKNSK